MGKLNLFIDGSWLFGVCAKKKVLATTTDAPESDFQLDFGKLNQMVLRHVKANVSDCDDLGDLYFATSIFRVPTDFDGWSRRKHINPITKKEIHIDAKEIAKIKGNIAAREKFASGALGAGYKEQAVLRPMIRPWIVKALSEQKFREKQVDTTLVALLVKYALLNPKDYHLLMTGDADLLPAISVTCPGYTENVAVASTHPDELKAENRQSSFSMLDFKLKVPFLFLQDSTHEIMKGISVTKCSSCGKTTSMDKPISSKQRPYCRQCRLQRT